MTHDVLVPAELDPDPSLSVVRDPTAPDGLSFVHGQSAKPLATPWQVSAERAALLKLFSECADSQRSWLLLEDYFSKLTLSRKDFSADDWWGGLTQLSGDTRLEELALVFMKSGRSVPNELMPYANFSRFAEVEQEEKELLPVVVEVVYNTLGML